MIRVSIKPGAVQVFRPFDQSYTDKVKGYRELPAYEKALRQRKVWMEPLLHGSRADRSTSSARPPSIALLPKRRAVASIPIACSRYE